MNSRLNFLFVPALKAFVLGLMIYSAQGHTQPDMKNTALKFVPEGQVVSESVREFKIRTKNNTVVEIEFERDGSFEEASGKDVQKDVLVTDLGIKSLEDALKSARAEGKSPIGEWSLDKSMLRGWYYEFEGFEDGKKMEYVVDAKTGKIISSSIDD